MIVARLMSKNTIKYSYFPVRLSLFLVARVLCNFRRGLSAKRSPTSHRVTYIVGVSFFYLYTSKCSYFSKKSLQVRVYQYWRVKLNRLSETSRIRTNKKLARLCTNIELMDSLVFRDTQYNGFSSKICERDEY